MSPTQTRRRVRHAAHRQAAPRSSGRGAAQLGAAPGELRLLLLRGRLARADQRVRGHAVAHRLRAATTWPTGSPPASTRSARRCSSSRWCRSTPSCYLLLQMVIPIPWLERVPTYKEQRDQLTDKDLSTIGFLGYPLLQTADVIIYDAQLRAGRRGPGAAPRAVARGGPAVPPVLRRGLRGAAAAAHADSRACPGIDNRKMSKSYGNAINLSDDAETVSTEGDADVHRPEAGPGRRPRARSRGTRCSSTTTPSTRTSPRSRISKARYRAGKVGDVEVKTEARRRAERHARADARAARAAAARQARRASRRSWWRAHAGPAPGRRRRWSACGAR